MPGASQRLRWHFSTNRRCTRRPQEASGGPRRLQETPGDCRKPHGAPGSPRKLQEARGSPRRFQEASGSPRRFQEAPRIPGGSRRIHEALGMLQDVPGDPGKRQESQALDESAGECAPRLSGSATVRKHARGAEARATFALSRAMCAAPHSCHEFRKADDKKVHVEKIHVDFALVVDRYDCPSRLGLPQTSARDVRRVPFLARISHRR